MNRDPEPLLFYHERRKRAERLPERSAIVMIAHPSGSTQPPDVMRSAKLPA